MYNNKYIKLLYKYILKHLRVDGDWWIRRKDGKQSSLDLFVDVAETVRHLGAIPRRQHRFHHLYL